MKVKAIKYLFLLLSATACAQQSKTNKIEPVIAKVKPVKIGLSNPIPAADLTEKYLPSLEGKTIAIVANQTSMVGSVHLVDTLLSLGINVKNVFAPEHGFRGNADAGEKVKDGKDRKSGLPIISLYGKNLKPSAERFEGIDLILFDIQDVGARFYTYISTMTYMMEACAEQDVPMMILDRPNPNGHYVDGPVLDSKFKSFVGMHPIPVVHGMTMGEYAQMVNGEYWLKDSVQCNISVVEMDHYNHNSIYELPVKPSPNLPNMKSIYLYPSLCFFEGTIVSAGRGTDNPFQLFGYPKMPNTEFDFTPRSIKGAASNPKFKGKKCSGVDLSTKPDSSLRAISRLDLSWLINAFKDYKNNGKDFFDPKFFDLLAGSDILRKQIQSGKSIQEIEDSWKSDLQEFKKIRKKYLIYD
ncbi:MAG: hypothetical protein ACI9FU_000855 [Granulosicoccus sp.]|jgi:uncharacterized protein YbbC (DUF1343 family)